MKICKKKKKVKKYAKETYYYNLKSIKYYCAIYRKKIADLWPKVPFFPLAKWLLLT